MLEVDGQPLCESTTILRYLGKRYGLSGKSRYFYFSFVIHVDRMQN